VPQCNLYQVPEYAAMMTVRRHAWHRPMRKQKLPPAAESSASVGADESARGSSGLWALLVACVAYLVCMVGAVYRAGRLPFEVCSSSQQRTATWKSPYLEHQTAEASAEEEYSAGHGRAQEEAIFSSAYWICAAQTGAASSVVADHSSYCH